MSFFGNLTSDNLEQSKDTLGGFTPLDTNAYLAEIKVAYASESASGAKAVNIIADIDGREYRETIYITNRNGENFYLNKNDTTKKVPLPGFTVINDICLVTTDKELSQQTVEDKVVKIYDKDAGAEVPKSVPTLVELMGKKVELGILRNLENKSEKQSDGSYKPTAETRESNSIDKVFHHPTKATVVEARAGNDPEFYGKWVEKNKGNTRDNRSIKDGQGGQAGRPGTPPAAGASGERKSLFG